MRLNKGAFTLLELVFVLIIIGLMLGLGANILSSLLKANKARESNLILGKVRDGLLGYVMVHGFLPCPDADGDGHADIDASGNCTCTWPDCYLPYLDIDVRNLDAYGHKIYYYVDSTFAKFSTLRGFCVHAPVQSPTIEVTDGVQSYPVVAVVISGGQQDKDGDGLLLDGDNVNGSPFCKESVSISASYDDLVKEISLGLLLSRVCDNDLKQIKIRIDGGYLCYQGNLYDSSYGFIYLGEGESVRENSCSGVERSYQYLRDTVDVDLNGSVAWDGSAWQDI